MEREELRNHVRPFCEITVEEFHEDELAGCLTEVVADLWVPYRAIVDTPRICTPRIARVYDTGRCYQPGGYYSNEQLDRFQNKKIVMLYLWEVWRDKCSPEYPVMNFELDGFIAIPTDKLDIPKDNKYPYREIHQIISTDRCSYCGCTDPLIEGDDVHPGYDGWPCCPQCKGV